MDLQVNVKIKDMNERLYIDRDSGPEPKTIEKVQEENQKLIEKAASELELVAPALEKLVTEIVAKMNLGAGTQDPEAHGHVGLGCVNLGVRPGQGFQPFFLVGADHLRGEKNGQVQDRHGGDKL